MAANPWLYAPVKLAAPRLRVGVLLDGLAGEQWVRTSLEQLAACPFAELVVAIVTHATLPPHPADPRPADKGLRAQLYRRYAAREASRCPKSSCFARVDFREPLSGIEVLPVLPRRSGFTHRLEPADVEALQARTLDVIFRFGVNLPRGDALATARYGVWSFHHDDTLAGRGRPAMVREADRGNPLTGVVLRVLTDGPDGSRVIGRSWAATPRSLWLSRRREQPYRKSIAFVTRCLRRLYLQRDTTQDPPGQPPPGQHNGAPAGPDDPSDVPDQLGHTPDNAEMARFFIRSIGNSLSGQLANRFTRVQWFLSYRRDPGLFIANTDRVDMSGFVPIRPPPDEFWADPSILTRDGHDFVFFERYRYQTGRGEIAVFGFDAAGRPLPMQPALRCDHHLSNPFTFEWEGQVYMVPESAAVSAVRLFRAEEFPTRWRHERDLLTGLPMVDATLHAHEGRWYMFVNVSETGGSLDDELFLFHADTPLGPWRPHAQNPIRSDVRSARPAGRLFRRGGALIRPSQDSSVTYGYAINLCEIDVLSPTQYRERIVERIEPTWRPRLLGCHALAVSPTCEVIDAKWRIRRRRVRADPSAVQPADGSAG